MTNTKTKLALLALLIAFSISITAQAGTAVGNPTGYTDSGWFGWLLAWL